MSDQSWRTVIKAKMACARLAFARGNLIAFFLPRSHEHSDSRKDEKKKLKKNKEKTNKNIEWNHQCSAGQR